MPGGRGRPALGQPRVAFSYSFFCFLTPGTRPLPSYPGREASRSARRTTRDPRSPGPLPPRALQHPADLQARSLHRPTLPYSAAPPCLGLGSEDPQGPPLTWHPLLEAPRELQHPADLQARSLHRPTLPCSAGPPCLDLGPEDPQGPPACLAPPTGGPPGTSTLQI